MTSKTIQQEIRALEKQGWKADAAPRAVEKHYRFPTFAATVKFLVGLGKAAENAAVMPSIRVENGTEVALRIGRPASGALTDDEIELAKSLDVG